MAVATYTTDLTDFEDFEAANTISTEFTGYTATSKGDDEDSDFPIQGTQHASAEQRTASTGSLGSDYGSNITWTSGWNFFLWGIFLAPAAVDTDANAGIQMAVGSSITAYYRWTVGGSDFGRYPYGGWQNFVVDPEVTTGRTTTGAPGTNYRWVGMLCDVISAISKGSPYGIDVIRYGRGELRVIDGQAAAYGTFVGMQGANDALAAKWGLFQENAGSYLWKGLISLGTTTAVDFRDSNRDIFIDDTRRVQSSFNRIEINHVSSNIEWININFTSLGTTAKGEFEMIDDCTFVDEDGVFTDMSTFIYQSGYDGTGRTWRRCGLVTQGGGTFDSCIFDEASGTVAFLVDDLDIVDDCVFNSDGTGYAIELDSSMAGNSYTMSGCSFNGYAVTDGSTGNEAIYNNTGGTVTISVGSGQIPTVHDEVGSTTIITASVDLYIIVKDTNGDPIQDVQVGIHKTSDRAEIVNQDTDINGEVDTSYSGTTPESVEVRCRKASSGATKYKNYSSLQTIATTIGLSLSITMIEDPNNNATT